MSFGMVWVLILTTIAPSANGGSSIAYVPGFASAEMCGAAGDHWLRNTPSGWAKKSAICVRTA